MTRIEELAREQLDAYNRADLDSFVACYHPNVRVFHGDDEKFCGSLALRSRYETLFRMGQFGASVPHRICLRTHCVDFEEWWRIDPTTGERSEGQVLVRYEEREGLIGTVQFLR